GAVVGGPFAVIVVVGVEPVGAVLGLGCGLEVLAVVAAEVGGVDGQAGAVGREDADLVAADASVLERDVLVALQAQANARECVGGGGGAGQDRFVGELDRQVIGGDV